MLARVLAGTQGVFVVFGVMIFNWSDWDMVVWWWWCGGVGGVVVVCVGLV